MRKIRTGVFETNSSSSHSIALNTIPRSGRYNSVFGIEPDENGYIHAELGEFGWGYDVLYNTLDKLSYVLTIAISSMGDSIKSAEDFYQTEDFKMIQECVKEHGVNGLIVDNVIVVNKYGDRTWTEYGGYIDHQSQFGSVQGFLDAYGITLEELIFTDKYNIIIDNDNH